LSGRFRAVHACLQGYNKLQKDVVGCDKLMFGYVVGCTRCSYRVDFDFRLRLLSAFRLSTVRLENAPAPCRSYFYLYFWWLVLSSWHQAKKPHGTWACVLVSCVFLDIDINFDIRYPEGQPTSQAKNAQLTAHSRSSLSQ